MTRETVDWAAVGERLRQIRKMSRLSQREFGHRFGVSQNMISLYENGRSYACVDFYIQVAQFGNKTIEWLLVGCENRATETLQEMRDLHEKMKQSLATVRGLLDRETDTVLDERILEINSPDVLREILLQDGNLPPFIQEALNDLSQWRELSLNGREVYAFRMLVRLFGDLGEPALHGLLRIVRDTRADSTPQRTHPL
jgi:transcriptional regulator with XRE-family HTH domain